MGERKVLNKYYPPDFDPAKIPRRRQPKNQQMKVRMMLPMSIRCGTCGNYIYKGTKFNSRKEDVVGETYLGIQIFRFYFKCTKCSAEITFKTDPQNSDYTVESGASRNFEPWRDKEEEAEREKRKRESEEMGDAMKSLENKALDSKKDMDILAALEEMRSMKSRHATVSFEDMLETLKRSAQQKEENVTDELDEQDEALIKSIVFHNSKDYVKWIEDDDEEEDFGDEAGPSSSSFATKPKSSIEKPTDALTKASTTDSSNTAGTTVIMPKFVLKPKTTENSSKRMCLDSTPNNQSGTKIESESKKPVEESSKTTNGLQALLATYDSDESLLVICWRCSKRLFQGLRVGNSRKECGIVACLKGDSGKKDFDPCLSTSNAEEARIDIELPRRILLVQFTCDACGDRTSRLINRNAYERGTVFLQCGGCQVPHKFVDNLGLVVECDFWEEQSDDSN